MEEAQLPGEDGAEEVEGAGDVEVTDIDVPVLVRRERLDEAGAFLGRHGRGAGQESGVFENAIDAGRTARNHVGIEHHEGEVAIAVEGMGAGEGADALLLIVGEPVIARNPGVVLVDMAEALNPVVELAGTDADPRQEATSRDGGLVAPSTDEIDDGVAGVVRHPSAF